MINNPARIIPCLLLQGTGLYKTVKFARPRYVGDPINAVRLFNEKEVDELIFLDIAATKERRGPNFEMLKRLSSECFMPLAYGGGVSELGHIDAILKIGVEKIILNAALFENPELMHAAVKYFGSSTIVASIDFRRSVFGSRTVYTRSGSCSTGLSLLKAAKYAEEGGCGEIFINAIDRDGTLQGYDIDAIRQVADAVSVPVIASGGAGSLRHFSEAIYDGHAAGVAAGSFFVFWGKRQAVLITYPTRAEIDTHVLRG